MCISFVGQNDLPRTVSCFRNVGSDLRVQNSDYKTSSIILHIHRQKNILDFFRFP
jgi:hypothetical protein